MNMYGSTTTTLQLSATVSEPGGQLNKVPKTHGANQVGDHPGNVCSNYRLRQQNGENSPFCRSQFVTTEHGLPDSAIVQNYGRNRESKSRYHK